MDTILLLWIWRRPVSFVTIIIANTCFFCVRKCHIELLVKCCACMILIFVRSAIFLYMWCNCHFDNFDIRCNIVKRVVIFGVFHDAWLKSEFKKDVYYTGGHQYLKSGGQWPPFWHFVTGRSIWPTFWHFSTQIWL